MRRRVADGGSDGCPPDGDGHAQWSCDRVRSTWGHGGRNGCVRMLVTCMTIVGFQIYFQLNKKVTSTGKIFRTIFFFF